MNFFDLKPYLSEKPTPEVVDRLGRWAQSKARAILTARIPADLHFQQRRTLRAILGLTRGHPPNAHASNLKERLKLHGAIGATYLMAWDESAERQQWSVTITPDSWLIDVADPSFNHRKLRAESARWMNKLGLTGQAFLEFQPIINHPASNGPVISPHVHIVAYPEAENGFGGRLEAFKQAMQGRCSVGEFVVGKPIISAAGDVMKVSSYGAKCLTSATRAVPSFEALGTYKFRKVPLTFKLAMRTAEIMSYMSTSDLIITRGKAAIRWRRLLFSQLNPCHSARPPHMYSEADLDRLWASFWRCSGAPHLGRVELTR